MPLLSLGCIGLSGAFMLWGTSIRGYGLGTVLVLFSLAGLIGLMSQPTLRRYAVAVLVSALSVQFLLQNNVLLLAIGVSAIVVLLFRRKVQGALGIGLVVLAALLSFLPYVGSYLRSRDWSIVVESARPSASPIHQLGQFFGSTPAVAIWVAVGISLVVIMAGLYHVFARRGEASGDTDKILMALLVFLTTLVGSEMFFRSLNYTRQAWYFLAPLAIAVTAIDLLTAMLWRKPWLRIARVAAAVVASLLLAWANLPRLLERQTNVDVVSETVAATAGSSDLVIVNPWQLGLSFAFYYKGKTPWMTVPQIEDLKMHRYDLLKAKMMSPNPLDDLLASASETLKSGGRVWVVGGAHFPEPGRPVRRFAPAPDPNVGWDNIAYGWSWNQQLGEFVDQHAAHRRRVPTADVGPVNRVENVPLMVAEGWKE